MHASSFFTLLATVLALTMTVAVVSAQSSTDPLPCFQEKCSALIQVVGECDVKVETNGTITFPTVEDTSVTDKCICKQNIIDAFDPCFKCGAEHQRILEGHSTQKLVDSCNINYKANVKMPGSGSSASFSNAHSAAFLTVLAVVVSVFTMA